MTKKKISFWDSKTTLWEKEKMLVISIFSFSHNVFKKPLFFFTVIKIRDCVVKGKIKNCMFNTKLCLKVALQILGRKFYKNTKKPSLYSQSLLIFLHKIPVVESHPTTREIRDLLQPRLTSTGNTVYFYMSSLLIYTLKTHRQSFKHSIR